MMHRSAFSGYRLLQAVKPVLAMQCTHKMAIFTSERAGFKEEADVADHTVLMLGHRAELRN